MQREGAWIIVTIVEMVRRWLVCVRIRTTDDTPQGQDPPKVFIQIKRNHSAFFRFIRRERRETGGRSGVIDEAGWDWVGEYKRGHWWRWDWVRIRTRYTQTGVKG